MTDSTLRPSCPKCGKPNMTKSKSQSGKVKWICRSGGTKNRVRCYASVNPWAGVRKSADGIKEAYGASTKTPPGPPEIAKRFVKKLVSPTKRYIVTSAQNGTPINKPFFDAIQVACKRLKAQLLVIPYRYKNPTSEWTESQENHEWWTEEIYPYLCNTRTKLNPNLFILGEVKVQPTASSPLTGLEGFTGAESGIVGHPRVQVKVIPVPSGKTPKLMVTTGSITVKNYSDSKQGAMGEFHHSFGAVIVEVVGNTFFVRQLLADKDGSFIDGSTLYTPTKYVKAQRAKSLAMGDSHVDVIDEGVLKATFGKGGIVEECEPEYIFAHDLADMGSCNPHEVGNVFLQIAKNASGKNKIRQEVLAACNFIDRYIPPTSTPVIVGSNHDNFLSRHIVNTDWRSDPDMDNAKFYLETALAMLDGTKMAPGGATYPSPFAQWAKKLIKHPKLKVLSTGESMMVMDVEFGLHGDKGPNGSRGSIKNIARIGVKTVIGHSHTPGIEGGCYQAGTSSRRDLTYAAGSPSSWMHAHVIQYANGKRSLLFIIDGKWRSSAL